MATLLYIFPHPDDESFGPAPLLVQQRRLGHDVHLLTLTRGEATAQRHRLGYSKAKMAAVRYDEMQDVADALDLTSLTVLEYPDGELAELNALMLEETVADHLHRIAPEVVVTYPVHGISGHPDHLVTHAVVKRVVCAFWADGVAYPQRLAFFALPEPTTDSPDRPEHLQASPEALIDCVTPLSDDDLDAGQRALDCYRTYQPVVEAHQPLRMLEGRVCLELFGEAHAPALSDLTAGLTLDAPSPLSGRAP